MKRIVIGFILLLNGLFASGQTHFSKNWTGNGFINFLWNTGDTERNILYPIPAQDRFLLKSQNDIKSDMKISFYDENGNLLLMETGEGLDHSQAWEIDMDGYHSGIYIVQFCTSEDVVIKKLITE